MEASLARLHKRKSLLPRYVEKPTFFNSQLWRNFALIAPALGGVALYWIDWSPRFIVLLWILVTLVLAFIVPVVASSKQRQKFEAEKEWMLQTEPHRAPLMRADNQLRIFQRARNMLPKGLNETLDALMDHATAILNCVDADPKQLDAVKPFLDDVLPACTKLVNERVKGLSSASKERRAELDREIKDYVEIFAAHQAKVEMPGVSDIEIDIKLLKDAMKADVE
jgi:phage shock protein PspC (stress-responsive transcriptional regulator)